MRPDFGKVKSRRDNRQTDRWGGTKEEVLRYVYGIKLPSEGPKKER